MADSGEVVFATILLTDSYLPGAMVLAHSIRDHGSSTKLVCLVTPESISNSTIDDIKTIYNEIIPVTRLLNRSSVSFQLLNRPDLSSVFTKIHLWRLTQYSRIIYLDADTLVLAPLDDLVELSLGLGSTQQQDPQTSAVIAAAPDVGWPDCFNSGVMLVRPDMPTYQQLLELAQQGVSFDGADQGLLNQYFDGGGGCGDAADGRTEHAPSRTWQRLSFAYNCTPSAHYQYEPAFRHFRDSIKIVHFIGSHKPWQMPRFWSSSSGAADGSMGGASAYTELVRAWWTVYDRHYRGGGVYTPVAGVQTGEKESGSLDLSQRRGALGPDETCSQVRPSSPQRPLPRSLLGYNSRAIAAPQNGRCIESTGWSSVPSHVHGEHNNCVPRVDNHLDSRGLPAWKVSGREIIEDTLHPAIDAVRERLSALPAIALRFRENESDNEDDDGKTEDEDEDEDEDPREVSRRKATFRARASNCRYKSPPPPPTRSASSSSEDEDDREDENDDDDAHRDCDCNYNDTQYDHFQHQQRRGVPELSTQVNPPMQSFMSTWDPTREPPPSNSLPEAPNLNFPKYAMSADTRVYQPQDDARYRIPLNQRHSSPISSGLRPQSLSAALATFAAANHRGPPRPPPIFPWELHASAPSRVFSSEIESASSSVAESDFSTSSTSTPGSSATSDIDDDGSATPRGGGDDDGSGLGFGSLSPNSLSASTSVTNACVGGRDVRGYIAAIQSKQRASRQRHSHESSAAVISPGGESEDEDANDTSTTERDEPPLHPRFHPRNSSISTHCTSNNGFVYPHSHPRAHNQNIATDGSSAPSSPRIRGGPATRSNFNNFRYSRFPYPSAEGVPSQSEWNPRERLDLLAEYPLKLLEAQTRGLSLSRVGESPPVGPRQDESQSQAPEKE